MRLYVLSALIAAGIAAMFTFAVPEAPASLPQESADADFEALRQQAIGAWENLGRAQERRVPPRGSI